MKKETFKATLKEMYGKNGSYEYIDAENYCKIAADELIAAVINNVKNPVVYYNSIDDGTIYYIYDLNMNDYINNVAIVPMEDYNKAIEKIYELMNDNKYEEAEALRNEVFNHEYGSINDKLIYVSIHNIYDECRVNKCLSGDFNK